MAGLTDTRLFGMPNINGSSVAAGVEGMAVVVDATPVDRAVPVARSRRARRALLGSGRSRAGGMLVATGVLVLVVLCSVADEAAVSQALAATEIADLADRSVAALSGGQRQRVWIALALAQGTGVMLLDEPTTFLDLAHQVEVLDLLAELNERERRTIVLVLHDLNLACRYATTWWR